MNITLYANHKQEYADLYLYADSNDVAINLTETVDGPFTAELRIAKYFETSLNTIIIPGVIDADPTTGSISFSASAVQMGTLEPGANVYTRYLFDPTGKTISVASGNFIITPNV